MATAGRPDPKALSEHSGVSAGNQQKDREAPTSPRFSSLARRLQEQNRQLTPHESITNRPCQGGRCLLKQLHFPFSMQLNGKQRQINRPQPQRGQSSEIPGNKAHVEPPETGTSWSPPENCQALRFQLSFTLGAAPHLHSHSLHHNPLLQTSGQTPSAISPLPVHPSITFSSQQGKPQSVSHRGNTEVASSTLVKSGVC